MKAPANILLRFLGILLLSAAALKGWRLLTEPLPSSDIWSYRPLLILTVELELALAIWLLSGLFKKAAWLVMLYHYDCPDCGSAIPKYEQMARELEGNEDFLRIALIAVPPYGRGPVSENCPCTLGKLGHAKEWFVTTPATALLTDGQVKSAWEEKAADLDTIVQHMAKNTTKPEKSRFFASTNHSTETPLL